MVIRAKIILATADGRPNAAIAADLGLHVDTVRKWRKRYWKHQLDGLKDLPRSGRPPSFTRVQVAEVKALACTPPSELDVQLARWSSAELAVEAANQGLVTSIHPTTVRRWLAADAIKPWQHRSWIFPRDPHFAAKAGTVLDLYDRTKPSPRPTSQTSPTLKSGSGPSRTGTTPPQHHSTGSTPAKTSTTS